MAIPGQLVLILQELQQIQATQQQLALAEQGLLSGEPLIRSIASNQQAQGLQINEIISDLNDLKVAVAQIYNSLVQATFGILHAIGTPQQAGKAVTLPPPPPGYGGPSSSSIAHDVWTYVIPGDTFDTGGLQHFAGFLAQAIGVNGMIPLRDSLFFGLEGDLMDAPASIPNGQIPVGDPTTILPTDTLLVWLNRESGYNGWALGAGSSHYTQVTPWVGPPNQFVCLLSEPDFEQLKATIFARTTAIAPVWPGLAHVTLGAIIPLAIGVTVPGPMHGVIVKITGAPSWKGFFTFDTVKSWRNAGALTFVDDAGAEEFPQVLGFEQEVFSPKAMALASECKVRTEAGIVGTVQPWTIT